MILFLLVKKGVLMNTYIYIVNKYRDGYPRLIRSAHQESSLSELRIGEKDREVTPQAQILRLHADISRTPLILDETHKAHSIKKFVDAAFSITMSYEQGDLWGGLGQLLFNFYAMPVGSIKPKCIPQCLKISYFNDEDILCGLTLVWDKDDHGCWSATLFENITPTFAETSIHYIANKKLFSAIDAPELDSTTAQASFFAQLKSEKIKSIINPIFKIINPSPSLYEKLQERSLAVSGGAAVIPVALGLGALAVTSLPVLAVGATAAAAASVIGGGTYWALNSSKPEEESLEAIIRSFEHYVIKSQPGIMDYIERKKNEHLHASSIDFEGPTAADTGATAAVGGAGIEARAEVNLDSEEAASITSSTVITTGKMKAGAVTNIGADDEVEKETPSVRL